LPSPVRRRSAWSGSVAKRQARFEIVRASAEERAEADANAQAWAESARQSVAQAPRDARLRHEFVRGLLARGRFAEAEVEADRFVADFAVSLVSLEAAADVKLARLDVRGAAAACAAAVELEPFAVERQRRAALAYLAAGDETRACAHFRAASALAADDGALAFEAFRCRAATGAGRLELLAELDVRPLTPELVTLRRALSDQRVLPNFRPAETGFTLQVACSPVGEGCPMPLLVSEDGEVTAPANAGLRAASLHGAAPKGRMRLYLLGGTLRGAHTVLSWGDTSQRLDASEFDSNQSVELEFRN
jgi:Ca-activated chloride channel family protein